ncbi:hypothetical protein BSFA1_79510 (plasmid) [Burkholderia sp. SFA1]|nr:hypothetical protein BYI23_E000580 [Burkholderia sp. YI23]BBQ02823.1 hypothetical protein BSFA1_79510 [Burkholderia sp. SFA1]
MNTPTQANETGGARKHHYVPQCYLKRFTSTGSKGAQLYVIDAKRQRAFTTTPANIAAERDFNRIDIEGEDPNLVESSYAEFEARLAPALVRIDRRGALTDEADLSLVLELIAILAVRNPSRREHKRKFQQETHRRMMELLVETPERWEAHTQKAIEAGAVEAPGLSYDQARDFVERGEFTLEVDTTRHVQEELKSLTTVYELLYRRSWVIVKAGASSGGFVTSDQPTTLYWDDEEMEGGFYPPGFASRDTTVFCPLSRRVAIRGSFDGRLGAVEVPPEIVASINLRTILSAGRQIYAENDSFQFMAEEGKMRPGRELLGLLQQAAEQDSRSSD